MADDYQADDDRLLTRKEAREHRREVAGMLDEIKRLWSEIGKVRDVIDRIEITEDAITFRTKKE